MKTLGDQIKTARQQRHLSQSALARQVGCKQSALSMYESGKTTALSAPIVGKLCKALDLLPPTSEELHEQPTAHTPKGIRTFCPNADCPSNLPIAIGAHIALLPKGHLAQEDEIHCAWCGEVLEKACPECGAHIHEGAYCPHCGSPYLSLTPDTIDPQRVRQSQTLTSWAHAD